MSVKTEIDRIENNIAGAYAAVAEMGGTVSGAQNSAGLGDAIRSIPVSPDPMLPLDPAEVYKHTRPADWLPMPEPAGNEMYLLFHITGGASSLLAFTATCTGSYTVALGTVSNGGFVQQSAVSVASGQKYEAELFAADWGNETSTGMKQVMIKVSGTDLLTWEPSTHSKKAAHENFSGWNIVEVNCNLPKGTKVMLGNSTALSVLSGLRYFAWYGTNNVTNASNMFSSCYSLVTVLHMDISKATDVGYMFRNCRSLIAIPELDTSKATAMPYMFGSCTSLPAIPPIDMSSATDAQSMFSNCNALTSIPKLNTSLLKTLSSMFSFCYALTEVTQINTGAVNTTTMANTFNGCYSLNRLTLIPSVTGWTGQNFSLKNCSLGHQALVELFQSLPTITAPKALTLTGNPGVPELTEAEKAIATGKNWTLTL